MLKKIIAFIAIVALFIVSTNAFAKSHLNSSKHSFRSLIVSKAAFDSTCNTIILTLANLPDCEKCPASRVVANTLRQATKRLEKINSKLIYAIPEPDKLELNEKLATGSIYRSIAADAFELIEKIESIIQHDLGELKQRALEPPFPPDSNDYFWVPAALAGVVAILGATYDTMDYADETTCNPIIDRDECIASGCHWCTVDSGYCEETINTNATCCEFITNEFDCFDAGCNWHYDTSSYCKGGYGRCPIQP